MNGHSKPQVFFNQLLGGFAFGWLWSRMGPLVEYGQIQWLTAIVALIAVLCAVSVLGQSIVLCAGALDWWSARMPSGRSGTERWAKYRDIKHELIKRPGLIGSLFTDRMRRLRPGPIWGRFADGGAAAIIMDYAAVAMTVGPSGSGKSIVTVIVMALAIRFSKVLVDFKGELACILIPAFQQFGEKIRVLNPGGLWPDKIGISDFYNPVDIIVANFYRPGGLRDVIDDVRGMMYQVKADPPGGSNADPFWGNASRDLGGLALVTEAAIDGYDATLARVSLLLENRDRFKQHLRDIAGIEVDGSLSPDGPFPFECCDWAALHDPEDVKLFCETVRAKAIHYLSMMKGEETRTYDSIVSGTLLAFAPFAFGRLASAMSKSTFSMDELKEGGKPTSLFIVLDASRLETYQPYVGLIQYCALTALKRHENKQAPVYFIMDEATNYKIHGLESLLTWGRSYGIRLHLIFQDLWAFARVYGEAALNTLLSEAEIKQFLPGQRTPKTLQLISKEILGAQSVMAASTSQKELGGGLNENMSEAERPLLTADEARRCKHGILIVRQCPPIRFEPVSYAEIVPYRDIAGINPFHKKPFKKKVRIKL